MEKERQEENDSEVKGKHLAAALCRLAASGNYVPGHGLLKDGLVVVSSVCHRTAVAAGYCHVMPCLSLNSCPATPVCLNHSRALNHLQLAVKTLWLYAAGRLSTKMFWS